MMPAAKHGDNQLGVDIHLCVVPPSPSPVPLPTPHMSVVFDPFDYIPLLGATVSVCGMKRATAGTGGMVIHIPPGFPFAPMLPETDDEIFMGSATVVADGDPMSHISHPVLGCQVAGMPTPFRPKKKGPPGINMLPTEFNLATPTNVFVGGPPTISLMGVAFAAAFKALGKFAKSGMFKRMRQAMFKNMDSGFLKCAILRAEPVNILNGEVSVDHQDFSLPGRIPMDWVRSYSSGNKRRGACGYGWETMADIRLEREQGTGEVVMHHPTKGPMFFEGLPTEQGKYHGKLELMDGAILWDEGHSLCVQTKEDLIYSFPKRSNGNGELPISKIEDLCENAWTYERAGDQLKGIRESAGRYLEVISNEGLIREIRLAESKDHKAHTFVKYQYDDNEGLVAAIDPYEQTYSFEYNGHQMLRHTDRNGLSFYYEFEHADDQWRVIHAWGDGGLYDYKFEYQDELNERRVTDSLGHVSIIKLDEGGLPISEIDPLGGMMVFEYDDAGRTIATADQSGNRTDYEYDERGNLLKLTRPDGNTVETEFNPQNKATVITDPNGGQWAQEWSEQGLLVKQVTPLGNESSYKYDHAGQLRSFINPGGACSELEYDQYGNLQCLRDALGQETRFQYDKLGNLTGKQDPLKRKTLYRYDRKSRLTDVKLPSRATIHCAYDPEDNLTLYRDENGAETSLEYFGQGEIAKRTQPDGHTVKYHYDSEEQLVGVSNQRGETYQLKRDALGRITEEIDYWGQARKYDYSACGYIERSTDPLGRTIDFTTDPLGRILNKTLPDPEGSDSPFGETFEYDANGNLTSCANPHIQVERSFDEEGHLLEEKQGDLFTITNSYDATGNRITRQTAFKTGDKSVSHHVQFEYGLLDQASRITIDDNPAIEFEYDAAGQLIRERLSPALQRAVEYSQDGYLTRQQVHAKDADPVLDIAYRYDAAGNLTKRNDAEFGIDKYTYDPVGRITAHLDPQGKVQRYLNDPAGDRLQTRITQQAANDDNAEESPEWSRQGDHDGAFYHFDRAGNLVERKDERGNLILRWDANQRLIESTLDDVSTRYQYDPLGRRIEKRTGERITHFTWDGDALVADSVSTQRDAEVISSGSAREWVYYPETFEPLAMLNGDKLLHYHNDPNGCPVRMTDSDGVVKWAASYTAWGGIAKLHVDLVDNPLRLQGQYEDNETKFNFNRTRYFDYSYGSFISHDPLGLIAGENLTSFSFNSIGWIDPLGLSGCKLNPKKIHFMQSSAKNITGKHTVLGNAKLLKSGKLKPEDLPAIRVWKDKSGKIWTLDHRRLAAFKLANLTEVPVEWASDAVVKKQMWKMTTKNGGTSIRLKLGDGVSQTVK